MPVANTIIRITDQATANLHNIKIALSATVQGTEDLQKALDRNTAAMNNFRTGANAAANSQNRVNATARRGSGIFSGLYGKLTALAGAYLSVQTAQRFVAETDAFIHTQARIDIMNDGLQTNQELYDKIYASAQRSLAPINEVAASVSKLGIVAKDAFKNNDEIIAFTEIFNKAAVVGGSSKTERSNAMYQLSQAFASGRLQGDELRSVRENAPLLFQSIQRELEKQYGKGADFKKLAADGLISPQIIKNAAFTSQKEIENAFKNMPMGFGDMFNQAENKVKKAMETIFANTRDWLNTPEIKSAINSVTNAVIIGINIIVNSIKRVYSVVSSVISYVRNLWFLIGVPIKAIGTAIIAVGGTMLTFIGILKILGAVSAVGRGITIGFAIAKFALGGATAFAAQRTIYQTLAQWGLNKAQMVGLLLTMKIILIALVVIAVIWAIIEVINFCAGTSISALGVIYGALLTTAAFIWNVVIGVINAIIQVVDLLSNIIISIVEFIVNAWNGGFNSLGDATANVIANITSWFLDLGKIITKIIDAIFGTEWSAELESIKKSLLKWGDKGKNEKAITLERNVVSNAIGGDIGRFGYADSWNYGYDQGEKGLSGVFKDMIPGLDGEGIDWDKLGNVGVKGDNPLMKDIAENTEQTAKNTAKQEEDYKMIRDVMAQRAVSRLGSTGGTVKVDMTNNNSINSNLDFRGWIAKLAHTMEEAASTTAKGIHN